MTAPIKVALIGSTGQLGCDIVDTVESCSSEVSLRALSHNDIEVTSRESVFAVLGGDGYKPDVIVNTAAFHKVGDCEKDPEKSFSVNAVALQYLRDVCMWQGCRLVHISTDYVFGGRHAVSSYLETDIPDPVNTYGVSKLSGEEYVKHLGDKGHIVRVASLFGRAGASGKGGNFVYAMIGQAKDGKDITVINDMVMSPTYTRDAAEKIWLLVEKGDVGCLHLVNTGRCSWAEFARVILDAAGYGEKEVTEVLHTAFKADVKRPLWSPLATVHDSYRMRPWEEAVQAFVESL